MLGPGRNAPLYHFAYSAALTVGRGDPDAEQRLDRFAQLLVGQPVQAQYHGEYVHARAEHQLWARQPREAVRTVDDGLELLEANPIPHFQAMTHAMGGRANADRAVLARTERNDAEVTEALARIDGHLRRLREIIDWVPESADLGKLRASPVGDRSGANTRGRRVRSGGLASRGRRVGRARSPV